jgi:hypothetical protein
MRDRIVVKQDAFEEQKKMVETFEIEEIAVAFGEGIGIEEKIEEELVKKVVVEKRMEKMKEVFEDAAENFSCLVAAENSFGVENFFENFEKAFFVVLFLNQVFLELSEGRLLIVGLMKELLAFQLV